MATSLYENLLQELGKILGISLTPDSNNSCLVRLKGGIEVQLELDKQGDRLLMGTNLGSVPLGRYRENLFREALRANGMPPPKAGTLAYSRRSDCLVLFRWLPARSLSGEGIASSLKPFVELATLWRTAIQRGEIPSFEGPSAAGYGGMFGLR